MVRAELLNLDEKGTVFYKCYPENNTKDVFVIGLDLNKGDHIGSYATHAAYRADIIPEKEISMWV